MRGSFSGCKSLDISDNVFVDEDALLSLWISRDVALRHLNISCLDNKQTVPSILDAVARMSTRSVRSGKLDMTMLNTAVHTVLNKAS